MAQSIVVTEFATHNALGLVSVFLQSLKPLTNRIRWLNLTGCPQAKDVLGDVMTQRAVCFELFLVIEVAGGGLMRELWMLRTIV